MIIINDLHLGVFRSAGATPSSALGLRKWQLEQFSSMLGDTADDLIILGDLFDTYQIPMTDLLETYKLLVSWLTNDTGTYHNLHLIPGNHDLSTDSTKLSSFQFLSKLLMELPLRHNKVTYLSGGGWVDEAKSIYAISHVLNQDLLNYELTKVPTCKFLLVHANYDNHFAKDSDHSLNISAEQVTAAPCDTIIFAHEHAHRVAQAGKVFIAGNQFPASVSDCLDGKDKYMTVICSEGLGDEPFQIKTWDKSNYAEVDWREPIQSDAQFIRIVGHCKPEEAADMANVVARYRKDSDAFVVSNAVRVGDDTAAEEMNLASLEAVRAFDVLGALKQHLTPAEVAILEKLT